MNIASGLFGFVLAVCYWPGISGPATSPRWAVGVLLVASLFIFRIRVTWAHVIGAALFLWSTCTYLWSQSQIDTVGAGFNLVIIAAAFCVGGQLTTLRPLITGLALGLGVSMVVCILQITGVMVLPDITISSRIPGLFANPLIYAEIAALVAVAAIAERMWWAVLLAMPGLLFGQSRAAFLALIIPFALRIMMRSWLAAVPLLLAALIAVLVVLPQVRPDASEAVMDRLAAWQSIAASSNLIGHGLGSYWEAAPQPIAGVHLEHPHNELLEAAFETGWIGAALLLAFFATAMYAARFSTAGLVLIALAVESFFAFPLHRPATAIMGLLCAGCAVRRLPHARDAFARCGMVLRRRLASRRILRDFGQRTRKSNRNIPLRPSLP